MSHHNTFLISFYSFAIVGLLIKLILNFLNMKHIAAHQEVVPVEFQDKITIEEHQKAAHYSLAKLNFSNITLIIHFFVMLVWLPFGGLKLLDDYVQSFHLSPIFSGLIFFALLSIIGFILDIPESLYMTFRLEEKFGFNKTTVKTYIIDIFKSLILSALLGGILLWILLFIMENNPKSWWVFGWIFLVGFQFLILWAYPKFIAPLFNKFTKLDEPSLIHLIDDLIKRCGLNFKDYYVMNASLRSSHGNAYFTGFGKNKRIVFFDTLLSTLTHEEVIAVLAHELGHLKFKHILKSLVWGILFMGVGFYLLGILTTTPQFFTTIANVNSTNYMALILFSYIIPVYLFPLTPLTSWISRKKEYEADQYAVKNANGKDLITALLKMYRDNSSTLTPSPFYSKFYYSHPPATERMAFIQSQMHS